MDQGVQRCLVRRAKLGGKVLRSFRRASVLALEISGFRNYARRKQSCYCESSRSLVDGAPHRGIIVR